MGDVSANLIGPAVCHQLLVWCTVFLVFSAFQFIALMMGATFPTLLMLTLDFVGPTKVLERQSIYPGMGLVDPLLHLIPLLFC